MSDLIVALDYPQPEEALDFIAQVTPADCALKVGSELFTASGAEFVRSIVQRGFRVFLDLKFHDIPNTVAAACRSAAELGVWMINVHASGGSKMMRAARQSLEPYGSSRPLLIAVTILTSMDEQDVEELHYKNSLQQQVKELSLLACNAGLDGVVCSAQEASLIKKITNETLLTVTPGIRLEKDMADDQQRIMTPQKAREAGSDYLVIGRPITRAENPHLRLQTILR
ncbi:MAG: orotidine-5'-phosphate decarboxylase [Legionellaceae bacterium]|nr:orotidine-5'-phosphate decarboxylase [Legionellaceae bacterium]